MQNRGRPKKEINLSIEERERLEFLRGSTCCCKKLKMRARIILLCSDGLETQEVAKQLRTSKQTVSTWRQRFLANRLEGLYDNKRTGRECKPVIIKEGESDELLKWSLSRSLPECLVTRAKIIILASEGKSNPDIVNRIGVSESTVRKWKRNYRANGIAGLHDEYRSGRPRTYSDEKIAMLLRKTIDSKPKGETHWSCRRMAEEVEPSAATINRIWKLFSLKPHKQGHFKISTDPFFVDKVVDVCGLYLNPPDNALVLCVDEKSQCQALERTQPILPMGLGYAEGVTDNYYRHGTTTLFAALNVATGDVEIACKNRHRHQEFLAFLNQVKRDIPKEQDVHIILDNYSTHKHEKVKAWITRNSRFHFHFTPTYSSWLNQVEIWFGIITSRAIRRGSFKSVKQLTDKIKEFAEVYNQNPKPFSWTATPEEIFEKLGRLCEKIY